MRQLMVDRSDIILDFLFISRCRDDFGDVEGEVVLMDMAEVEKRKEGKEGRR